MLSKGAELIGWKERNESARKKGPVCRGIGMGRGFHTSGAGAPLPGEAIDLNGAGRQHAMDALAGALSVPVLSDPHLVAFAAESYWRGEVHRVCDRVAATTRLMRELSAAGVEQVIVVSASADRASPHALTPARGDFRSRAGDDAAACEAA